MCNSKFSFSTHYISYQNLISLPNYLLMHAVCYTFNFVSIVKLQVSLLVHKL